MKEFKKRDYKTIPIKSGTFERLIGNAVKNRMKNGKKETWDQTVNRLLDSAERQDENGDK